MVGARFEHPGLVVENRPWSLETEVADLRGVDVGLAPLPDTDWGRGKCGLKVLQYMALEKPVVSSRVGAHVDMLAEGETGHFAGTLDEWAERIARLLEDPAQRTAMGRRGRAVVLERYSVDAVAPRLYEALAFAAGRKA